MAGNESKDDPLYTFIRERGLSADVVAAMKRSKIDTAALRGMNDEELKEYFPIIGDRLAVKFFVNKANDKKENHDNGHSKRKESVLDRLRKKMKGECRSSDTSATSTNRQYVKDTRVIEIGLMTNQEGSNTLVKSKAGGGIRTVPVKKTATANDLTQVAVDLFFVQGSKLGSQSDYTLNIIDFQEMSISDSVTVDQLFATAKFKTLRIYLLICPQSPLLSESPQCNGPVFVMSDSDGSLPDLDLAYLQTTTDYGFATETISSHGFSPSATSSTSVQSAREPTLDLHHNASTPENIPSAAESFDMGLFLIPSTASEFKTLENVLSYLSDCLIHNNDDTHANIINVTREDVLDGGYRGFLRKSFDCSQKLSVKFAGEFGIDDGGPTREFLRLAFRQIAASNLFYGPDNRKYLSLDSAALTSRSYEAAGRILAYGLIHRGPLPCFLDQLMYDVLSGEANIDIDNIPSYAVPMSYLEMIREMELADNEETYAVQTEKIADLIDISGCGRYMRFSDKYLLLQALKKFIVFDRLKPALDQFREGLGILRVFEMVTKYNDLMRSAFTNTTRSLDATVLKLLLQVSDDCWSVKGSNRRLDEEKTYSYFLDYLVDAEETYGEGELELFLQFVTGADAVPPLGFSISPRTIFRHRADLSHDDPTWEYPTANTCANMLSLPCPMNSFEIFRERMHAAIRIEFFSAE